MMSSFTAGAGSSNSTSASLIERVRDRDNQAWQRLADLYSPLVYSWTRRGGLSNGDAMDVVQNVFRAVFQGIENFQRDGGDSSFRAWLWSITRNQVRLFFRQQRGPRAVGGDEATAVLQDAAVWFDQPDEPKSAENRRQIAHRALELVRGDFNANTWEAFCRTTLQQQSAAEAASALGLTENAVRQAKFRVLQRLRQELDGDL